VNSPRVEPITSLEAANESISWISGYETEAEVKDAAQEIIRYFGFDAFVFGALSRTGEREHYRYLVGCAPEWCYTYTQNKWYAIDPYIDYALQNTAPIMASDIQANSGGQQRLLDAAADFGYRAGVVVPAHSSSSAWVGVLYLPTAESDEYVRELYPKHRSLMRAFALELLEWWDQRLRETRADELRLDELDLELLVRAYENATNEDAAKEIGITFSRVKARYERLYTKLGVTSKREAVEKAIALGLLKLPA
jgi:DNA-binding CsgD family transcriptional regulator